MSGIYIRGMEMPTSCYKCPLRRRDGMDIVCPVAHERFSVADVNILEYRLNNCPLGPVSPHGRLIDADALIRELEITEEDDHNGATLLMAVFLEVLKSAPTIIEAEEDEI